VQAGRLKVKWEIRAGVLEMLWEEQSGPRVEQPIVRGFGTRSVIGSIESQLGGSAEFDWRPEGLVCRLSVPLEPSPEPREQPADHQGPMLAAAGTVR
jgi:two-component sensor histidine kinase